MDVYEYTRLDDWLDIHNDNCDARHTQRACRSKNELLEWLPRNLHVYMECDNINCKYHWKVYKSVFFIDENSVLSYLKCPVCHKFSVTAKWVYFTGKMMGEWECGSRWMYDSIEMERYFEGNIKEYNLDPDKLPYNLENYFHSLILHFHQQYPIRTEGNHFIL